MVIEFREDFERLFFEGYFLKLQLTRILGKFLTAGFVNAKRYPSLCQLSCGTQMDLNVIFKSSEYKKVR